MTLHSYLLVKGKNTWGHGRVNKLGEPSFQHSFTYALPTREPSMGKARLWFAHSGFAFIFCIGSSHANVCIQLRTPRFGNHSSGFKEEKERIIITSPLPPTPLLLTPQPIVNKFQFITVDFAETYFGMLQLGLMLSNAIFIRVSLCNTDYSGKSLQAAGAHDCLWHVQLKGLLFQEWSSFLDCIELGLILIASFSQES